MDVEKIWKNRHLYVHEFVVCIFIVNIELLWPVLIKQVECQICVFTTQQMCQHMDKNYDDSSADGCKPFGRVKILETYDDLSQERHNFPDIKSS
jgi:hypothetical protein